MSIEAHRDARRLRWGLLVAGLLLLGVMIWVAVRATSPAWHAVQAGFWRLDATGPHRPAAIQQRLDCAGRPQRCTTCHLGIDRRDLDSAAVAQPYRAHPPALAHHLRRGIGCGSCHGGTPRALDATTAHARPGGRERDPLMGQPHVQAACGRCHLPGARAAAPRLLAGARLYLELGCPVCHPLHSGGRGGADYGPDLRAIGRRDLDYLTASLIEPSANFAGSTMPSFAATFAAHPPALVDLLVYLESLVLERPAGCAERDVFAGLAAEPCAGCHAGPAGRAQGRRRHRCPYLLERAGELRCARCHPETIPAAGVDGGRCPVIVQRRPACVTCHSEQVTAGRVPEWSRVGSTPPSSSGSSPDPGAADPT